MSNKNKKYHVFISAAEPSADAHCAGLIAAIQENNPGIEFIGVGGPKMEQAGCELLENTTSKAAMIYKAFSEVARFYKIIKKIKHYLKSNEVDLVIVCDSPSFNFHVAKAAKKAGIKTLFFVAPQLWAWGGWRIRKLRKRCDKLCCLLPFEQNWFGQRGIDAVFVGNPLMDEVEIASSRVEQYADFDPKKTSFALMPGSRPAEIESLWKPMQQIALRLKEKYPESSFVTVAVDARKEELLRAAQIPGFECDYSIDSVNKTAGAVDFSIVTSGSATLEVAAAGCPMVIMYQSSRILWHLFGRWIINAKYLSLVNILAGKELVPEFMPYFTSIEPIIMSIEQILEDKDKLSQLSRELTSLTKPLAEKKACKEVANIAVEMLP
jgi:lipid-A-disaccharide synthase